ncbi:DUF4160 domain-containing protein [Sporolituus thermophilus]|uniref:DUF4160 domain-containing protein n=1 Tax=Sporolituus thermophilus DSM 23256 TaxID=1123285 RepID=A0A1G7MJP3_9FIRM|nr:DUF4160 domain-containing protein [Sporolituus thermophilus]SDF61995.1 protein of unknown function [Sporolituus thermophilus DSM 23256]
MSVIEGDLPGRAQSLVVEWATKNHEALLKMWQTQEFQKLDGLD